MVVLPLRIAHAYQVVDSLDSVRLLCGRQSVLAHLRRVEKSAHGAYKLLVAGDVHNLCSRNYGRKDTNYFCKKRKEGEYYLFL